MILRALRENMRPMSYSELAKILSRDRGAIAKASLWLESKGLIKVIRRSIRYIRLGKMGELYLQIGLPERRLVNFLKKYDGVVAVDNIDDPSLREELPAAIMWAKKKGWVSIESKDGTRYLRLSSDVPEKTLEEELLLMLKDGEISLSDIDTNLLNAYQNLSSRPDVVEVYEDREYFMELTDLGRDLPISELEITKPIITKLSPELLITGKWREFELSPFDIHAPTKHIFTAKRHPLSTLIKIIKDTFVELGFEEIKGPLVELAFWNFDALFQPQDHPAREMHDTFYLAYPSIGNLPKEFVEPVKESHEHGGDTGSIGWRYRWSADEAKKLVLRTHTTATTIRYLAYHKQIPIKVFSVDRIYRNEKVDWKHLAEFHQIEGIIVDKDATFRELMGLIKEFCTRIGLRDVVFRPSYFPYTEPSAEAIVYIPAKNEWLELFGMGIFRPEVTIPLGVKHPVLAWGGGLERLAMALFDIDDIRMLYTNDLEWIRSLPRTYIEQRSRRL